MKRLRAEDDDLTNAVLCLRHARLCAKDAEFFVKEAQLQRVGFGHIDAGGLCADLDKCLAQMANRLTLHRGIVHGEISKLQAIEDKAKDDVGYEKAEDEVIEDKAKDDVGYEKAEDDVIEDKANDGVGDQ